MSFTRFLKWSLGALLLIISSFTIFAWIGSWVFLDKHSAYTTNASQLPIFDTNSGQSLVQIPTDKWTFRARVAGFDNDNAKGNLILLHGFPETSIMWEQLTQQAADAGYRVIAFDQRGYSPGARPGERSEYSGEKLVSDVIAVADYAGFQQFHLVGHDWGSVIGWQTVFKVPERIETFSSLSIPHISAIVESFEVEPELQSRSAYMAFFWLPWVPELRFSADDFLELRSLYEEHPKHHVEEYLALFRSPGALSGAFNWYRGALAGLTQPQTRVETPTLFIWGKHDTTTSRLAVELQHKYMNGPFEVVELDTGHWVVETHPEEVTARIISHIERQPAEM